MLYCVLLLADDHPPTFSALFYTSTRKFYRLFFMCRTANFNLLTVGPRVCVCVCVQHTSHLWAFFVVYVAIFVTDRSQPTHDDPLDDRTSSAAPCRIAPPCITHPPFAPTPFEYHSDRAFFVRVKIHGNHHTSLSLAHPLQTQPTQLELHLNKVVLLLKGIMQYKKCVLASLIILSSSFSRFSKFLATTQCLDRSRNTPPVFEGTGHTHFEMILLLSCACRLQCRGQGATSASAICYRRTRAAIGS